MRQKYFFKYNQHANIDSSKMTNPNVSICQKYNHVHYNIDTFDAIVEYITSTGLEFIDLNIIPNNETGVYMRAEVSDTSDMYYLGFKETSGNTRFAIGHTGSGWYQGWGSYSSGSLYNSNYAEIKLNYLNDKKWYATNGSTSKTLNLGNLGFIPTTRIYAMRGVTQPEQCNATTLPKSGSGMKLYELKISQNSEIIMDLIPVRKNGVGYLYDKISNKLFGNSNNQGQIGYGPDLYDNEIEYLESTGIEYIDTGVVLTKNYYIEIDAAIYDERFNSGYILVLGAQTDSSTYSQPLGFNTSGHPYCQVGNGNSYARIMINHRNKIMRHYICSGDGTKQYISCNETANKTISGNLSSLSMYIFANHHTNGAQNYVVAQISTIKIIINNILVRDFIPVKKNEIGYMYDKITNKLFGNSGTGEFICGPIIN